MIESNHRNSLQRNSKTHHNMADESYAQSLRAIRQALEALRIDAFTLEKEGTNNIVRDWESSFLKKFGDYTIPIKQLSRIQNSSELLAYDSSDAERLETKARARRGSEEIKGRIRHLELAAVEAIQEL